MTTKASKFFTMTVKLNPKKILVVEDSQTSSMLIQSLFEENQEFIVHIANNGNQALRFLKNNSPPELILLDIMLPDIDGYSVLRRLKRNKATAQIPVIMVSAKDSAADVKQAIKLGAIDYVKKPIGINKLYERVKELFEQKDNPPDTT